MAGNREEPVDFGKWILVINSWTFSGFVTISNLLLSSVLSLVQMLWMDLFLQVH